MKINCKSVSMIHRLKIRTDFIFMDFMTGYKPLGFLGEQFKNHFLKSRAFRCCDRFRFHFQVQATGAGVPGGYFEEGCEDRKCR